jgi:hypothetical protein
VAKDSDELALRLKRLAGLSDRLRVAQASSTEAQQRDARIQREIAELHRPLPKPGT